MESRPIIKHLNWRWSAYGRGNHQNEREKKPGQAGRARGCEAGNIRRCHQIVCLHLHDMSLLQLWLLAAISGYSAHSGAKRHSYHASRHRKSVIFLAVIAEKLSQRSQNRWADRKPLGVIQGSLGRKTRSSWGREKTSDLFAWFEHEQRFLLRLFEPGSSRAMKRTMS